MSRGLLIFAGAIGFGLVLPALPPLQARDYGVMGQTFPIAEPDLLATIQGRLEHLQANGGLARLQEQLKVKAADRVRRPTPVAGITRATAARQWSFDPSIVVENDIRDHKGNLIARSGQRVNPLDFMAMSQELVFLDGDDQAQLDWAARRFPQVGKVKLILVNGSPFDRMKEYQRRFFFDQQGQLTAKFGISHTPAVVRANGKFLAIEELVVPPARVVDRREGVSS